MKSRFKGVLKKLMDTYAISDQIRLNDHVVLLIMKGLIMCIEAILSFRMKVSQKDKEFWWTMESIVSDLILVVDCEETLFSRLLKSIVRIYIYDRK